MHPRANRPPGTEQTNWWHVTQNKGFRAMPKSADTAHRVARLAVLKRYHPHNSEQVTEAERDLRVQLLTEAITKAVDAAPPLTAEQRVKLAELLSPVRVSPQELQK
jgi:hypothetical protein